MHICTRYQRGGSEQRLRDMVEACPEFDHQVVVGLESDVGLLLAHLPAVTVDVESTLQRSPNLRRDAQTLSRLRRRIIDHRVSMVVTHQSKAGALGRAAAFGLDVPVLHSASMANFGPGYPVLSGTLYRAVERALVQRTAEYVVVGRDLARRLEQTGIPSSKIEVVRSAARLPELPPDRRVARRQLAEQLGAPLDRPWLLYAGSLDERKNVLALPVVLQQLMVLEPKRSPFLIIAGSGPLAESLNAMVKRMDLTDDVAMLGHVGDARPLFVSADVVLLLSRAEGLPQVLVQAAAARTPVVAYDVDGVDELLAIGVEGTVVDQSDVLSAANAVQQYLRRSTRPDPVDLTEWDRGYVHQRYRTIFQRHLGLGLEDACIAVRDCSTVLAPSAE